ncbi:type A2 lantipeptide [Streptomyces sp. NBC_00400]|uniref:type A2 lantipeptide n=1 Tax=Streptomyces sp. NBC_00400 TaxID=2975737 RepID=UPI002E22AE6F
MNSIPQVQTQEISDADLDNVSGGLLNGVVGTATNTVDSIAPVSGAVGTATGLVDGATGANVSGVVGTASGLVSGL